MRRPDGLMGEVKREAARNRRHREATLLRDLTAGRRDPDEVVLPERNVEVSDEWNAW